MPKTTGQARHEIESAAQDAEKRIAKSQQEAINVIAQAAAEALKVSNAKTVDGISDHDVLLRLVTSFDNYKEQDSKDKQLIRDDIQKLGDGIVNRVDILEKRIEGCLTKFEFGTFMSENHAPVLTQLKKIDGLEKSNIIYMVTMGLYGVALGTLYALVISRLIK